MLQHIPRRRQRPKVVLWGLFVVLASIPEVGPSPRTFHMHGPGWSSPQPLSTHCALFFAKSVDLDQSPSFVLGAIGWALVFRPLGTRLVRALVRRWCRCDIISVRCLTLTLILTLTLMLVLRMMFDYAYHV